MHTPWWNRYPILSDRILVAEQGVLEHMYPQFRLAWTGQFLAFRGTLRSNYGSVFHVEVRLPPRYPEQEPHLWVLEPSIPRGTEHLYPDGRVCAHATPYVPYRTNVAAMVSVFAGWLFRFDRRRLDRISWEEPLEFNGQPLSVNPDGTLYVKQGG